LAAGKPPAGRPAARGGVAGFHAECARLRLVLADQIEKNQLRDARETVLAILCLNPGDADAMGARELIEEQLASAVTHPVGEIRRLMGHQSAVNSVAVTPDGGRAVSGGGILVGSGGFRTRTDNTVRLWDLETGQEIRSYLGATAMITAVTVSPDGKWVLAGSAEGGVHVWDLESARPIMRIGKRLPHVYAILLSRDGQKVFTASSDKVVRLWDVVSGERVNRYSGHGREVTALALNPSGHQLLTGCNDGFVRRFEVGSGQEVRHFEGHRGGILGLAFSPDGMTAVSGGADSSVRLWDVEKGSQIRFFMGHSYTVTAVGFTGDGKHVVSAGDTTVRVWNVDSGKEMKCLPGHTDSVLGMAISPIGDQAVTAGQDMSVRFWQLPSERVAVISASAVDRLDGLPTLPVPQWVDKIVKSRVLDGPSEKELVENIGKRMTQPKELLRHLVERGWMTDYQVREMAMGHELDIRLGNYVLLRLLGEGGMGQVFKARRHGTTDEVALKIVLPEMTRDAAALKQFMWEIQALARMSHPNIIRTYDAGSERGRHFFTMEYIEGTDLAKLVKKYGPVPVPRACVYIRQAAMGLEHAHEHCLIHRDIKPANLLLTLPKGQFYQPGEQDGGHAGVIKVLDWGLAGLRPPTTTQQPGARTREESTGTVDYMSPEQAMDMSSTDIRADIYSLGCTLYHLLTGQPPFHGLKYAQKLIKHQTAEPTPVTELRPSVTPALHEIIRKMMAKRPADRFRSPAHVATALAPFCKE
jgi:hypothetical protein